MNNLIYIYFIPEIFLSFALLSLLVFNVKVIKTISYNYPVIDRESYAQVSTIFFLMIYLYFQLDLGISISWDSVFVINDGIIHSKIILAIIMLILLTYFLVAQRIHRISTYEYYFLVIMSFLAISFMMSSADLLTFYLAMELQSLSFYVMAAYNRKSLLSLEAGLKYFLGGAFISIFYLLGASLIYAQFGTCSLYDLNLLIPQFVNDNLVHTEIFSFHISHLSSFSLFEFSIILICIALLFKIANAPFHFISADVYDGAPLPSTLIFMILRKLGIFTFFCHWVSTIHHPFIENFLILMGIVSIFYGTMATMPQTRLKRIYILSSVAQIGFMVAVIGPGINDHYSSLYVFLFIYLFTSLLLWGNYTELNYRQFIYNEHDKDEFSLKNTYNMNPFVVQGTSSGLQFKYQPLFLNNLSKLGHEDIYLAFTILVLFFSIGGIPPAGGFFPKLQVLLSFLSAKSNLLMSNYNYIVYAILIITISAVSVYYYLRVIKMTFFEPLNNNKEKPNNDFIAISINHSYTFSYLFMHFTVFGLGLIMLYILFPDYLTLYSEYLGLHYITLFF